MSKAKAIHEPKPVTFPVTKLAQIINRLQKDEYEMFSLQDEYKHSPNTMIMIGLFA